VIKGRKQYLSDYVKSNRKASLTVEASLVMPLFLYFMIAFLYFIQIFTVQEKIQSAITQMGLNLAKTAYIYDDFLGAEEAQSFDQTIFGMEADIELQDITSAALNGSLLKLYVMKYLDVNQINQSCIKNGFEGVSFYSSKVMGREDCIDIIVRYQVKIPISLFGLEDMFMIQRVKLRGWTGNQIPAVYTVVEEGKTPTEDTMVFITETGSVYHVNGECSHIKLSVFSVIGIPSDRRNDNGAKYYPCESCSTGISNPTAIYYITSDGTRYHTRNDCPRIKRTVRMVPLSKVQDRNPCKRCGQ